MANKASPDWSNAIRVCFSDSDEEVFEEDSIWRPIHANRLPDENLKSPLPTLDERNERDDFESDVARQRVYFSSSEENVSFEDLRRDRNESTWNAASAKTDSRSYCRESESSQRVGSLSDCEGDQAESAEMHELQQRRPSHSHVHKLERKRSIVDGLLLEIYDRSHRQRADSLDSDTFTECSSASEGHHDPALAALHHQQQQQQQQVKRYYRHCLQSYSREDLQRLTQDLRRGVTQMNLRLVRQLKRRDRSLARLTRHCDVITAVLQAASLKRQIDTRMKFSLAPPPGPSAFEQWKDAMKAVNRLPMGIPAEFRKKVWLSLADHYIRQLKIDWHNTVRLAFNDRSNPDDDKLGMQIVKDLHRTGCSSFSGQDNEEDRAVLKRVLLAYARWNKRIGYCQGFNVIVALLLDVTGRKEDDALKVMIYLIDHVLPESYFDNNLRALSVDMAVFRDLLRLTLPTLSARLDSLQHAAQDLSTGCCYEPPLSNVFTMQWFLTLFATCLPKEVVLRVWDAILLEGSEVLLRTALCLWGKLARRIMAVESADEFYSLMGDLSADMMEGAVYDADSIIKAIYAVAPFPFPQLTELREKYTYNIRPFSTPTPTPAPNASRKLSRLAKAMLYSDDDEPDEDDLCAMAAFPGMTPAHGAKGKSTDISVVGPGVFGGEPEAALGISRDTVYMERMSTDISALKMHYDKLRFRQRQAHVIITAVSARKAVEVKQKTRAPVLVPKKTQAPVLVPKMDSPLAINHLFVGKVQGRNRLMTKGPCLTTTPSAANSAPTKQVPAQTTANPASCQASPTAKSSPPSSSPRREPGESQDGVKDGLQQPLQTDPKAEELCRSSDSEREDCGTGSKSGVSAADCLEADTWSEDQNGRQEEQNHAPPSSENQSVDSECLKRGAESRTPCPPASPRHDAAQGLDDGENQPLNHTPFTGSNDRLSHQREGEEGKAMSSSQQGTGSHIHSDHLHSRNCEVTEGKSAVVPSLTEGKSAVVPSLTEGKSAVVPSLPKNEHQARWELGVVDANCAESFPAKTNGARDAACSQDNGFRHSAMIINRSLSMPTPSTTTKSPPYSSSSTPVHKSPLSSVDSVAAVSPAGEDVKARRLSSPCCVKSARPFNPFPARLLNSSRARTGLRLGLYTPSTLESIQAAQRLGGLGMKKASHASS